jgi:hypothetical protein
VTLQKEIDRHRKEIHTDSYPMSIGELVNLYRDGELDIHPEFQRFYRWSLTQKSRWIESILLGIPLPSLFVAQRDDGVWDVIDGLQRISTILEFMGELRGDDKEKMPQLALEGTHYLPSLKDKRWRGNGKDGSLSIDQQRFIKRAKLDIKIILRESHEGSKYELFQRLNTGGTFLSAQEVRSCLLISVDRDFYRWLASLAKSESFQKCLPLTERQEEEQYDLELATRFMALRNINASLLPGIPELGEFLDQEIVRLAEDKGFNRKVEEEAFRRTFDALAEALETDAFLKFEAAKDRFSGAFLISAFEVIGLGLGYNYKKIPSAAEITQKIKKKVWAKADFLTSSGLRATQRLPKTIPFGREVFAP